MVATNWVTFSQIQRTKPKKKPTQKSQSFFQSAKRPNRKLTYKRTDTFTAQVQFICAYSG